MKIYTCPTCNKTFNDPQVFNGHKSSHRPNAMDGLRLGLIKAQNLWHNKSVEEYNLNPSKCLQCGIVFPYERKGYKFCNRHCSITYSNSRRPPLTGKTKSTKCTVCGIDITIPLKASIKIAKCILCKEKIETVFLKTNQLITVEQLKINISEITCECIVCKKTFYKLKKDKRKTCSDNCKLIFLNETIKNPLIVVANPRRSKNEIHFAELCKSIYKDVLTNKPIFNGWDADVILPNEKIAALWNGAWHHRKIGMYHSLALTQSKDKIRIKEITDVGYTPYIIDDFGWEDPKFVLEKFEEFKAKHPPIL